MIRVYMRRMESMDLTAYEKDNSPKEKEFEVYVKVTLSRPVLNAEPYIGIAFKNVTEVTLSETTLSFADMKKVMEFHELKNWDEVKRHIEDKYNKYYSSLFFGT